MKELKMVIVFVLFVIAVASTLIYIEANRYERFNLDYIDCPKVELISNGKIIPIVKDKRICENGLIVTFEK